MIRTSGPDSLFQPISLKEMNAVKLLDRIDTKYILSFELLPVLLNRIQDSYKVLDIDGERNFRYVSLYYDTPENKMYNDHHNGRANRYKVRFREYVSSKLCFLEVKFKKKGTRTIKKRTTCEKIETELSEISKNYIADFVPFDTANLVPAIYTNFSRMTLVNNEHTERVTIDTDLYFLRGSEEKRLDKVVIIEIKRGGKSVNSFLMEALKYYGVRPKGFSKYCLGRSLFDDGLRKNNFKEKILITNKIKNGQYYYRNV